jgi:hypothetical protein
LQRASPEVVTSVTVTGRLATKQGNGKGLATSCHRLAAEYGLSELVSLGGTTFTVRFCRHLSREVVTSMAMKRRLWQVI